LAAILRPLTQRAASAPAHDRPVVPLRYTRAKVHGADCLSTHRYNWKGTEQWASWDKQFRVVYVGDIECFVNDNQVASPPLRPFRGQASQTARLERLRAAWRRATEAKQRATEIAALQKQRATEIAARRLQRESEPADARRAHAIAEGAAAIEAIRARLAEAAEARRRCNEEEEQEQEVMRQGAEEMRTQREEQRRSGAAQPYNHWTEDEVEFLTRACTAGRTWPEVCEGLPRHTEGSVKGKAGKLALIQKNGKTPDKPLTPEEKQRMLQMRAEVPPKTWQEVGDSFGLSRSAAAAVYSRMMKKGSGASSSVEPSKPLMPEWKQRMLQMRAEVPPKTWQEVGDSLGRNPRSCSATYSAMMKKGSGASSLVEPAVGVETEAGEETEEDEDEALPPADPSAARVTIELSDDDGAPDTAPGTLPPAAAQAPFPKRQRRAGRAEGAEGEDVIDLTGDD